MDRIILITGATSGIGKAAALQLAKLGHQLILVGRDDRKLQKTVARINNATDNAKVSSYRCDLSLMREVRRVAETIRENHAKIDVLINNAGARFVRHQLTDEGIEVTLATNHLGHFVLTLSLIDLLKRAGTARIINVSSSAHYTGDEVIENIKAAEEYDGRKQYASSKLANVLFTKAMAERLENTGIAINAMAPGGVATNFARNNGMLPWLKHRLYYLLKGQLRTPSQGAETVVFLATSDAVLGITGQYFEDKREKRSSAISYSRDAQDRVWLESIKLSGVDYKR